MHRPRHDPETVVSAVRRSCGRSSIKATPTTSPTWPARTLDRWPDDGSQPAAQVAAVLATAEYVTGHPDRALEMATSTMPGSTAPGLASVTLHRVLGQARRALGDLAGSVEAFRRAPRSATSSA